MSMDEISKDQAAAIAPVMPAKWDARGVSRPDSLMAIWTGRIGRSEIPARRYWLSFLDAPLTAEIRAAGALDINELADAAPRILRCDVSRIDRETVQEWWTYAMRRRWLEPVGSVWGLTERAHIDLRTERERVNSPNPMHAAGTITRWAIPSLIGAVGLATGRYLMLEAAILAVAVTIVASLLFTAGLLNALEPPMERWLARRACDWLDGRRIRPARGTNCSQVEFSRLYPDESLYPT